MSAWAIAVVLGFALLTIDRLALHRERMANRLALHRERMAALPRMSADEIDEAWREVNAMTEN